MPFIGNANAIGARRRGVNWSAYWASLISATVENAAPTNIVLTFSSPQTSLKTSDFRVTINGDISVISNVAWVAGVLTLTIADTVIYGDTVIVKFLKTGHLQAVTNNTLADYYVRLDGSNTAPYDTPAKAAIGLVGLFTYIASNGTGDGQVVSVGAGTFASYMSFASINHNNLIIVGAGEGQTIVAHATSHIVTNTAAYGGGAKIRKLTLMPPVTKNALSLSAGGAVYFDHVEFRSRPSHAEHLIRTINNYIRLNRCMIKSESTGMGYYILYATGTQGLDINYCYSIPTATGKTTSNGFVLEQTGTTNINNCTLLGMPGNGIVFGNGTLNVRNSIIQANLATSTSYIINRLSGTVNAYNNNLITSPFAIDNFVSLGLTVDSGNTKTSVDPKFVNYSRRGYIMPRIDDTGALTTGYINEFAALLATKNVYGTWFPNVSNMTDYEGVRSIINSGRVEVGSHGYSHTNLLATSALNVTYSGAGTNPTCAFDGAIITLTTDGGTDLTTIDTTNAAYNTLGELATTHGGVWVINIATTKQVSPLCLSSSLKTQTATSVPCTIEFDRVNILSGLLKNEVADAKTIFENAINSEGDVIDPQTGVKYEMRSYGATYNEGDATTKQAVKDAGFNAYAYTAALFASTVMLDLYAIRPIGESGSDGTESSLKTVVRAYGLMAALGGYALSISAHSVADLTIEQWGWIIDELLLIPNITITSYQKMVDEVMGGDWTDVGDGVYSRAFDFPDLHLLSTSPCINAGVDASLTKDIEDSPVMGLPDIGCYEYQP